MTLSRLEGHIDINKSISAILADLGVTHERDGDCRGHKLYFAGRFIGHFDAHQVGALIREYFGEG